MHLSRLFPVVRYNSRGLCWVLCRDGGPYISHLDRNPPRADLVVEQLVSVVLGVLIVWRNVRGVSMFDTRDRVRGKRYKREELQSMSIWHRKKCSIY